MAQWKNYCIFIQISDFSINFFWTNLFSSLLILTSNLRFGDANTRAFIYNNESLTICFIHDLLSVGVVWGTETVGAQPLHQVEISCYSSMIQTFASDLSNKANISQDDKKTIRCLSQNSFVSIYLWSRHWKYACLSDGANAQNYNITRWTVTIKHIYCNVHSWIKINRLLNVINDYNNETIVTRNKS